MPRDVLHALLFYPRGGSAQVIRYLSAAMVEQGVDCHIVSGSLGGPGDRTYAPAFFREIPVDPVDYSEAVAAWERGEDPLQQPVPLHPSYEDRPGVPDRIFTSVDPGTGEKLEAFWVRTLDRHIQQMPDLFHVHHLSPLQAAVRANWPEIPMIGHLHGTELKMLKAIDDRSAIAEKLGLSLLEDAERLPDVTAAHLDLLTDDEREIVKVTRWASWQYGDFWARRLRDYAHLCDRLIVLSDEAGDVAADTLGFDRRLIHAIPNGVDVARFTPEALSSERRLERWRYWLVEDPQGWDESGVAGCVRYQEDEIEHWFGDQRGEQTPVLMFVGRFVNIKRVPLLIRAYKRAQTRFAMRSPLVIWGGNPGEWEDEHPVTVAREEDVRGVFFVGWRGHNELPVGLNSADVMVAPSTNEPFGQVYLEAMACRLPVIGTRSGGPPSFINTDTGRLNGWLVPPDDEEALAEALVEAVNNPDERRRRGQHALESVRAGYSWTQVARTFQEVYELTVAEVRVQRSATHAPTDGCES